MILTSPIPPAALPRITAQLADAIARGGASTTPDEILASIAAGRMQLWLSDRSMAVTAVSTIDLAPHEPVRVCQIPFCAGDMNELLEFEEQIIDAARSIGCTRLEGGGRLGWSRALRDRGWRPTGSLYKEIA